jgi:hypothetical protein
MVILSFKIIKEKSNPNKVEVEKITIVFNVPIIFKDSIKKNKDKPNPPNPRTRR